MDVLVEERLKIVAHETSLVRGGRLHQSEFVVDASALIAEFGEFEIPVRQMLKVIERRLTATCIEHIDFKRGRPRVKIRPIKALRRAGRLM